MSYKWHCDRCRAAGEAQLEWIRTRNTKLKKLLGTDGRIVIDVYRGNTVYSLSRLYDYFLQRSLTCAPCNALLERVGDKGFVRCMDCIGRADIMYAICKEISRIRR